MGPVDYEELEDRDLPGVPLTLILVLTAPVWFPLALVFAVLCSLFGRGRR